MTLLQKLSFFCRQVEKRPVFFEVILQKLTFCRNAINLYYKNIKKLIYHEFKIIKKMNNDHNLNPQLFSYFYCSLIFIFSILIGSQVISIQIGILIYLGGFFFLCTIYFFLFYVPSSFFHKNFLKFIVLGLFCRVILSFSMPLWEDDWARYLWEGYIIRSGFSPYINPPDSFFNSTLNFQLQEKEIEVLSKINHPDWPAIYSPVVQLFFTLCSLISPLSLYTIKFGYIILDLVVLQMIKIITNKKSAVLYFLFPVLLKEVYINSHFEVLSIFFCTLSIFFMKKNYSMSSCFFYGLSVHSKIYLGCIFPFFILKNSINSIPAKSQFLQINLKNLFKNIISFLTGFLLPVVLFELIVQKNTYYGIDTLWKFANEFQFNPLYFTLLKFIFPKELSRKLILLVILSFILYSIFYYKKYFIDFQISLQWAIIFFMFNLLFSPIVNAWYFLILLPFYFLLHQRLPYFSLLLIVPQLSYLTKINLKINETQYFGFYEIYETVQTIEITCITLIIIMLIKYNSVNRKRRTLKI